MATSPINPNEISWDSGPPPQQSQSGIDPSAVAWDGPAVSDQPQGLTKEQQQQVLRYIPRAKSPEDLDAFARSLTDGRVGINNADEILKDHRRTKRTVYGFTEAPDAQDKAAELPNHDADFYGDQIRRGVGDLFDAPANIADLVYKGGQALPRILSGGPLVGDVKDLPLPDIARPGALLNAQIDKEEQSQIGEVPEASNTAQRYAGAGVRLAAGGIVPAARAASALGKLRALGTLVSASVGGGVGGEAAHDLAPAIGVDPDKARLFGQVLGAHVGGTPLALKPIRENAMVNITAEKNPQAAYLPEVAQGLADKANSLSKGGLVPKGRAQLDVPQINDIGLKYLNGMDAQLTRLVKAGQLDPERAATLKRAMLNRDGLKPDEIDALKGDTSGDAVAAALNHYQAMRALTTPGGGRVGIGSMAAKGWNLTAGQIPYLGEFLKVKPTDADAARIRAADKAINRAPLFQKLESKVGPSPVGPAIGKFQKAVSDSYEADRSAQAQASADAQAKADSKASRHGMTDAQYASYSARSSSAADALNNEPVPAPRKAKVQSALNKYQQAAQTGVNKLSDFDEKLNAPPPEPKAPKRSALDTVVAENIKQGVQGNYNSYADTLGVNRDDVLQALKTVKTDDVDPFEIDKLVHGYKLSPAGRAALIPRLQKALTDDGTIAARAKEAEAPKAAPKASPTKAAEPAQASPEDTGGNYRDIRRPKQHAEAKARNQGQFDKARESLSASDSPHSQEIVSAASDGLDHIRNGEKTTESAMRYFDNQLGPKLRSKGFLPEEIEDLRKDVENMATVGKTYRTDAEFEKGAKTGKRGRPRKPQQPTFDDVPF